MKLPQFILGITIIFWGWQTELWLIAIPMMLIYETSYFVPWRWELSTNEFMQVGKFCGFLTVGLLFYLLTNNRSVYWIFDFFQWFPVIFFPFVTAQAYSISDRLDIRVFFYFLRKKEPIEVNLSYPFFCLLIVAASAGNLRDTSFYIGMFTLSAIALWFIRSSRFNPALWVCLMILAGSMGVFGHIGLHRLHRAIERETVEWLSSFYHHHSHHYEDPTNKTTAIGDIGSVKLTNDILFRVKPSAGQLQPERLRKAVYNKYVSGMWTGVNSEFIPVKSQSEKTNWIFTDRVIDNLATVTISNSLDRDFNLVNLPQGTTRIIKLSGEVMEQNQYGTVRIEGEPGLRSYEVAYSKDITLDSIPTKEDLDIPIEEKTAINKIVAELNLRGMSPQEILKKVATFFNTEFTYSLELARQDNNSSPLSAFLLDHRSGHCEYFATATALLLRAVEIPTRYVVGYSVHEFNPWENQFIVRGRNAHAWTLVYIDGIWREFDTTPPSWIGMEDVNANQTPIWDFLSLVWFQISFFLLKIKTGEGSSYYWLLLIPLAFILLRQFNVREGIKRINKNQRGNTEFIPVGIDSEIYLIETALNQSGIFRNPYESWYDWIQRLEKEPIMIDNRNLIKELKTIIKLHYRYRFDPQGMPQTERAKLGLIARAWLKKYENKLEEMSNNR